MNVRVRGIYATALTALFGDETVVQASQAIRERFDDAFPVAPAAVAIETTDNRQGVTLVGSRGAVERARERLVAVFRYATANRPNADGWD